MLRGRATNTKRHDEPSHGSGGQGSGGSAEISLAWEAPRPLLPGKKSFLALGILATAGTVWAFGISNSASALSQAWSSIQPKWHLMRPATALPVARETTRVAEPDAPAAVTIAPVGGVSGLQPLAATRGDAPFATQAETRDAGGAITILTSTALEQSGEDLGTDGHPASSPEAERLRISGGTAAKRSASGSGRRRDTSWTGSFFER